MLSHELGEPTFGRMGFLEKLPVLWLHAVLLGLEVVNELLRSRELVT